MVTSARAAGIAASGLQGVSVNNAPSMATPSQVSDAVTSKLSSSSTYTPNAVSTNPHDAPGYNPATDPTSSAYNPSAVTTPTTTKPVPATPTTPPAQTPTATQPVTTPATQSTPSGIPGDAPLTGSTADQAGQAIDQLKAKYGKALTDITGAGVDSPASQGSANAGINAALDTQPEPQAQKATTTANVDNFFDPEANPALQQSTQQLQDFLSPPQTRQDLTDAMSKLSVDQSALTADKLELMNMKNIMAGTADDLRNEVTAANGFATESQIQALAVSRNQTLLKQSTLLTDQMSILQDAVSNDTTLMNFEKDMANTQFTQRLGILNYQSSNYNNMQNAARTSLSEMQKTEGWNGIYQAALASGDPTAISRINATMGAGFNLATAAKNDTTTAKNAADLANTQANTANTQANTRKTLQEANDASGVPNPAKANTPGYTAQGVKYTNENGAAEIKALIQQNGLTGTRNLLAPNDYNHLKSIWVLNNLKDSDFDSIFGGMKDPKLAANHVYN